MPDLSANISTIRADGYRYRLYLSTPSETTVLAGTVSATPSEPTKSVTYTNTSGSHSNVNTDMEAEFFRSGVSLGRVRVAAGGATSIVLQIEEVSQGRINIATGDTFLVYENYRLRGKLVADNDTFDKDSRTTYSNQTSQYPPVAIAGGMYANFVDPVTNVITVSFPGASSYTIDPDSSGSKTYLWDVKDGTIIVGSTTTGDITATFPPGKRWVSLTVTDSSNSKTQTIRVAVNAHERTGSNAPIEITGLSRSANLENGWELQFEAAYALSQSTLPDGALICVWAEEWYGTTQASYGSEVSGRSHIKFVGYLVSDSNEANAEATDAAQKRTTFRAISPLAMLAQLPGFSQVVEIATSPANWQQAQLLTTNRMVDYLLRWHTTLHGVHDVLLESDNFDYPAFYIQEQSPLAQVREICDATEARLICDRGGRIKMVRDLSLTTSNLRTAANTTLTLTDADIVGFTFDREHRYAFSQLEARGFNSSSAVSLVTPLFSRAPGRAPAEAPQKTVIERLICIGQTDVNTRAGRRYAKANATYYGLPVPRNVMIELRGGYDVFDLYAEWVKVTLASGYNWRGIAFSNARLQIESITIDYNADDGSSTVRLQCVSETDGETGITYNPPADPTADYTYTAPLLDMPSIEQPIEYPSVLNPFAPDGAVPLVVYAVGTSANEIKRMVAFDYTAGTGTVEDMDASTTTTGDPRWAWSDPYSPDSDYERMYVLTTTGLWKTEDRRITNPVWTLVANNTTIFGSSSDRGYYGEMSINRRGYIIIGGGEKSCAVSFDYGATWTRTAFDNGSTNFADTLTADRFYNGSLTVSYYNSKNGTTNGWVYAIYRPSAFVQTIRLNRNWGVGTWETVKTFTYDDKFALRIQLPYRRAGGVANKNDGNQLIYYASEGFGAAWGAVQKDGTMLFDDETGSGSAIASAYCFRPFNFYTQDGSIVYAATSGGLSTTSVALSESSGTDFLSADIDPGDPLIKGSFTGNGSGNVNGWGSNPNLALFFARAQGLRYTPDGGTTFYNLATSFAFSSGIAYAELGYTGA